MAILDSLVLEGQHNDQWCWAAVTLAICKFLGDSDLSQERIVCTILGNESCALVPTPPECNIPFPLEFALGRMQHLDSQTGVLAYEDVRQQIEGKKHPVAISVMFQNELGSTSHYCLIKGCEVVGGIEEITLLDPSRAAAGESQIGYEDLRSGSILGGPWTQSFTVR